MKKHLTLIMALCCLLFATAEATAQEVSPTRRLRRARA